MIIDHVEATPVDREIDKVEAILKRYPHVTGDEAERAVAFLVEALILDRGRLSSRPGMAAKMEQIRKDHAQAFRPSRMGYALLALFVLALAAIIWMMANIG
jgi:hypothetical protein